MEVVDQVELGQTGVSDLTLDEDTRQHPDDLAAPLERAVGERAQTGPFTHRRPGTKLDEDARLGNFVETKKAHLMAGAKANHLAYLGDASIGAKANIGAGTITDRKSVV